VPAVANVFALALQHHQAGDLPRASQLYHDILQADPHHADAHHLLGVLACQAGRYEQARACIRMALTLDPRAAVYHANLGVAFEALGQLNDAAASYRQALTLRPRDADTLYNLGNVLRKQEKWQEAVTNYRQALRLVPHYAEAHCNLGLALAAQGNLEEAVAHHEESLRLSPNSAEYHNNLGVALALQDRLDEAVACHREALRINPNFAPAHHSLGCALQRQNKLDEALKCYQQAIRLDPHYAEAHWNRSILWLSRGDFEQGWPEYEWRWTQQGFTKRHEQYALWDGSDIDGKTILLHAEQGLGDTLQMIRYVPQVAQRGGSVIVECQPPLARLLSGMPEIDRIVPQGSPLPAIDFQVPLLSLPGIFHTSQDTIPAMVPYLQADPALVDHWRRELQKSDVRRPVSGVKDSSSDIGHRPSAIERVFKIGIAWQGNPAFGGDRQRSMPLESFAPLAQLEGVRIFALQKGSGAEQLPSLRSKIHAHDLGSRLDENGAAFVDTAAVMMSLHLVITADTAIDHLAGALGVPVWVCLPMVPDWRWQLEREDSPWYPTMRLFRQKRQGDWDEVLQRIALELNRGHHRGSVCLGLAKPSGGQLPPG
jgi:tetratricopeptide (TPR) repeat protein